MRAVLNFAKDEIMLDGLMDFIDSIISGVRPYKALKLSISLSISSILAFIILFIEVSNSSQSWLVFSIVQ